MNSGVYAITNLVNGNRYIGSSKNIGKRWALHKCELNKGTHHNSHLQNAWNLYGKDNFEFTIIEECDKEFLLDREQSFLDTTKPEYNMCLVAGSCEGIKRAKGKKLSVEHRAKISVSMMGNNRSSGYKHSAETCAKKMGNTNSLGCVRSAETRAKISAALKGKILSRETRAKMSTAAKGHTNNLGHKSSAETCAKLSAAKMGHTVSPETRAKMSIARKKYCATIRI